MTVDASIDAREGAPTSTPRIAGEGKAASSRRLRRRRDRRDVYSRVLLVVAAVVAAMGLGGLHWAALVPSAILALLAGFFGIRSLPGRVPYAPALVPVALAGFTLLQLVPLPLGVLRALSPHMFDVWDGALSPLGEQLQSGTLSADPHATLVEALKWASYGGVLAAAIAAGSRRGVRFGAVVLFGCSVLVAATTVTHGLLNLTRVYGAYVPTFSANRWQVGPFLNPNNLAGYLNLGLFSGIGLMLSKRPPIPRVVTGIVVATLVAVVVLGGSRAGLASMLIGLCTFGALLLWVNREKGIAGRLSPLGLLAGLGGVVVGAVLLAWLGGTRETWRVLFDRNVEKLDVMYKVVPLVLDHPVFGVGRGAFESVFPAYHFGAANVVYAHPENFVVQWIAEWGVPVGCMALVAFAVIVFGAFRDAKRTITGAGIFAGIVAVLLQNLLDLGLELPGLAFAVALGLGILWGHDQRDALEGGASIRRHLAPRLAAWAVLGLGFVLATAVSAFARTNVSKDRIAIHDAVAQTHPGNPNERAATFALVREAMLEHPADPYFPRVGGLLAWYSRQNPMPWMTRSLERGMHIGQTHFAIARMLARAGAKEQALLEIRLACTYAGGLSGRAARVVLSLTVDPEEILRAAPEGEAGGPLIYTAALGVKQPELRIRLLSEAIERQPQNAYYRVRLVDDLSLALASADPNSPCTDRRDACEKFALEHVDAIERLGPSSPEGLIGKARVWAAQGRAGEAELLLRHGCQRFTSQSFARCQHQRVTTAALTHARELVDAASRDLASAGCGSPRECSGLYRFLGNKAESVGDSARAFVYYKRAAAEEPNNATLSLLARMATAVGDEATARNTLMQLRRANPDDTRVKQAIEAQQRRLFLAPRPPR